MRVLDPEKGTITRSYAAPAGGDDDSEDGSRDEHMGATLEQLKQENEALAKVVHGALGEAVKKIAALISASEKKHASALADVQEAVAGAPKIHEPPRREIKEDRTDRHDELVQLIEDTARSIVAQLKVESPPETKAPTYSFRVVARDSDGKIKEVQASAT